MLRAALGWANGSVEDAIEGHFDDVVGPIGTRVQLIQRDDSVGQGPEALNDRVWIADRTRMPMLNQNRP